MALDLEMVLRLTAHIEAMKDDPYLCGHPEWQTLVEEAGEVGEHFSTYLISSNG